MRIIVVSGMSGSGKSVALHMLEDLGYYCIDNMPAALLKPFVSHTVHSGDPTYEHTAIGLDARNAPQEIATVPALLDELKRSGIQCEVIFLQSSDEELLRRYAETRRKHPMASGSRDLREAIELERRLLTPIAQAADRTINTSRMGMHDLRRLIHRTLDSDTGGLSLTFESFGFKHGIPGDADFVFDARSLPNPYWEPTLQGLTGRDPAVIAFLRSHPSVQRLLDDIDAFLVQRLPEYQAGSRGYLTVAVGCTGGRHRSVYLVDQLLARFAARVPGATARHNNLDVPRRRDDAASA